MDFYCGKWVVCYDGFQLHSPHDHYSHRYDETFLLSGIRPTHLVQHAREKKTLSIAI
jgi:hypothetical protein